ncbi:MAG: hypothetical protein M4579_004459 [Chaenotheca gracillima]|nr:MAG: hypothetical protein M4579_004459 [Chaenotheca gracillima]
MATVRGPVWPQSSLPAGKDPSYTALTERRRTSLEDARSSDARAQGAIIAARRAGSHAKLHKRAGSASSTLHSPVMPSAPRDAHVHSGSTSASLPRPYVHEDFSPISPTSQSSSASRMIKPFSRKPSGHNETSFDLSRSTLDRDAHDLFISESVAPSRSAADVSFASGTRRGTHARSASGISQLSTATSGSGQRHYAHPMRQTPRPFTPPIAQSYTNSVQGSEYSSEGPWPTVEEEPQRGPLRGYNAGSSTPPVPPLRIHTDLSSSRLPYGSQSNLAGTPSSHRFVGETMTSPDAATPKSRSSLEQAFRIRSKEPLDPASRAASIRAARQAFTEKEELKAQKAEEEALKAANREHRKREKREAHPRRHSLVQDRSKRNSNATSEKAVGVLGREYSSMAPAPISPTRDPEPGRPPRRSGTAQTTKGAAKGSWVEFMVWLKTRILKLGRKMSGRA